VTDILLTCHCRQLLCCSPDAKSNTCELFFYYPSFDVLLAVLKKRRPFCFFPPTPPGPIRDGLLAKDSTHYEYLSRLALQKGFPTTPPLLHVCTRFPILGEQSFYLCPRDERYFS